MTYFVTMADRIMSSNCKNICAKRAVIRIFCANDDIAYDGVQKTGSADDRATGRGLAAVVYNQDGVCDKDVVVQTALRTDDSFIATMPTWIWPQCWQPDAVSMVAPH